MPALYDLPSQIAMYIALAAGIAGGTTYGAARRLRDAWFHTVRLNIGRSRWKRRRRRERLMSLWGGSTPVQAHETVIDIDSAVAHERLWRHVAALPTRQRDVLLRRIVEDCSATQTAEQLEHAQGTVKGSPHRALKTFQQQLTDAH